MMSYPGQSNYGDLYTNDDLVGKVSIPSIVSKQGSRLSYQINLMFRQITNLFDHTLTHPSISNREDHTIDISTLRNRYLKQDKVNDLVQYVSGNLDSYILPPISAVCDRYYSFMPYNKEEIIQRMGPEYDLVKNPELTEEVLVEFDSILQGHLIFRESEFNVEIMDGNHRVAAIHQLTAMSKEYKNLRIGVQIFFENDLDRQRQAFVDMNTSTPIDKTILTLFSTRDPLSIAAKEVINENSRFFIDEFSPRSSHYIGFDAVNDSITRNSHSVVSLNMIKNMLVRFGLGDSGTPKKFISTYVPDTNEYESLLNDFSVYLKSVFRTLPPFAELKRNGTEVIPKLREKYITMTGAGLYLIANLGYLARNNGADLTRVVNVLATLEWNREIDKVPNQLFRSGILSENGNISNNRNAHISTLEKVARAIGLWQ